MDIIGQLNNKNTVAKWEAYSFPRFIIITGEKGSGKKLMANYVAKHMGCTKVTPENGVEAVREIIDTAYRVSIPTCYIFTDADKMSAQAKNALLKVTEEPPKKAYFILTVEDINNTLATLKSRGTELKMEPYTEEELSNFSTDEETVLIASNPGQVQQLLEVGTQKFIEFCKSVLDNVATVSGVNALKIGQYFKYKEDGEGYDIPLFFNCLMFLCRVRIMKNIHDWDAMQIYRYTQAAELCSKYKNEMKITGIKKDAVMDSFIFKLRRLFSEE